MNDFDKFQSYLFKEARVVIGPMVKQHMEELGETIWNDLFDLNGKRTIDRRQSEKEVFIGKLFYGYIEIDSSYNSLKDIQIYIGRFPYGNTGVSKIAYLIYHIANYMNEIYILSQRLNAYLAKIGRLYQQDTQHQKVIASTKPTFKGVRDILGGIVTTRGTHVHKSRYKDKDTERLDLLRSFANIVLNDAAFADFVVPLRNYYESEYREVRQRWRKTIKKNNEALNELLNIYFGALLKILFDQNGNLIYPKSIG